MTRRDDFSRDGRLNDALDVGDVGHHEAALSRAKTIPQLLDWKSGLIPTNQAPERHVTRACF